MHRLACRLYKIRRETGRRHIKTRPIHFHLPIKHSVNVQKATSGLLLPIAYSLLEKSIYTLFDGLTYNTRGYFASCVVFFRAPKGRGKIEQ